MRVVAGALLLVLLLAGCSHAQRAEEPDDVREAPTTSGSVELTPGDLGEAVPFAAGNLVHGLRMEGETVELAAPISSVLIGTLTPAVVPDAVGARLVYNAWRDDRPVLRLHDLETGEDTELDEGAASAAWRGDAALAYFKADEAALDDPAGYFGHVVVHDPGGGEPTAWTLERDRYVVAAWARQRLLVYRLGTGWPDLLVVDGPQRIRVLARQTALLAVSPDGGRALVFRRGESPVVVRLVSLGDGAELARVELPEEIEWLLEAGSWAGERAVASASPGLVTLRVERDSIELEQILRFGEQTFRPGLHEPQLDEDGAILVWGELHPRPGQVVESAAIVSCDPAELRCVHGRSMPSVSGPRLVHNPSRPLPGR